MVCRGRASSIRKRVAENQASGCKPSPSRGGLGGDGVAFQPANVSATATSFSARVASDLTVQRREHAFRHDGAVRELPGLKNSRGDHALPREGLLPGPRVPVHPGGCWRSAGRPLQATEHDQRSKRADFRGFRKVLQGFVRALHRLPLWVERDLRSVAAINRSRNDRAIILTGNRGQVDPLDRADRSLTVRSCTSAKLATPSRPNPLEGEGLRRYAVHRCSAAFIAIAPNWAG